MAIYDNGAAEYSDTEFIPSLSPQQGFRYLGKDYGRRFGFLLLMIIVGVCCSALLLSM
jgi:hypothetical protein